MKNTKADPIKVRVEIARETLLRLLASEHLCAAELRCLDCPSKKCLWRLCLDVVSIGAMTDHPNLKAVPGGKPPTC